MPVAAQYPPGYAPYRNRVYVKAGVTKERASTLVSRIQKALRQNVVNRKRNSEWVMSAADAIAQPLPDEPMPYGHDDL